MRLPSSQSLDQIIWRGKTQEPLRLFVVGKAFVYWACTGLSFEWSAVAIFMTFLAKKLK